jgi:hypothetical protein
MANDSGENTGSLSAVGGRAAARRRAQSHFSATEKRDNNLRIEIQRERTAVETKTAKLRALRLAKEIADRQAALDKPKPAKPAAKRPRKAG